MSGILPGSDKFGRPSGCFTAMFVVALYVGCVLGGIYWLYRYVWP